jgi:chorismate mutase
MAEGVKPDPLGEGSPAAIDDLRKRIDDLDEELVRLLNERASCALRIGHLKQRFGIQIYQPGREQEVLRHVQACTTAMGGPLSPSALARLFERVIDEARRLERESAGRQERHDDRESDVLGEVGGRGGWLP